MSGNEEKMKEKNVSSIATSTGCIMRSIRNIFKLSTFQKIFIDSS